MGSAEQAPKSNFSKPQKGKDEAGKDYYDFQATSTSCMKSLIQWGCKVAGKPGDCTGENEECKLTGDPYSETGGTPELMCVCAGTWCAENAASEKAVCIPPAVTGGVTVQSTALSAVSIAIALLRA